MTQTLMISDSLFFRVDPEGCVTLSESADFDTRVEIDRDELEELLPFLELIAELKEPRNIRGAARPKETP